METRRTLALVYRLAVCFVASPLFLFFGCALQSNPANLSRPSAARANSLPEVHLPFSDFFKLPVGPRGLEPTERLLSLAGKRVRVRGYLVQEEQPVPGLFMLTPMPASLAELADGPSDYLPSATLFVHLPKESEGKIIGYRPGTWTASGTLELGAQTEANGRLSYVRLRLDDLAAVRTPENGMPEWHEEGTLARHRP